MLLAEYKLLKEKEKLFQAVIDGEVPVSELTREQLLELDAFLFNHIVECYGLECNESIKH